MEFTNQNLEEFCITQDRLTTAYYANWQ